MRRLRYNVAMSLDGCIAGPQGEFDWIVEDRTIDFDALFAEFDTLLMGRKTFEVMQAQGPGGPASRMRTIVVSSTLRPADHPGVSIIRDGVAEKVDALKASPGKDIWLFGGGTLFRGLLDAGLVDTVEVAVMPVLLGGGIPFLQPGQRIPGLRLTGSRSLPSGIVMLAYELPTRDI
jgi:dihydrofolate reductase